MKHLHKFLSIFVLLALVSMVFVTPAHAFDGRSGENVTIEKNEVIDDDLYVSADTFTLDGTVKGDLIAAGTLITINGTVEGDLIAAGQTVIINGKVMDDVRIAGAALQINENAEIGDDVVAAGASLETKKGSVIGGEIILGSAQASLAGDVTGDVLAGTSALELSGTFGGDVNAYVDATEQGNEGPNHIFLPNMPVAVPSVNTGLTVADGARIKGNLDYTSTYDISIPGGVVAGKVNRTLPQINPATTVKAPTKGELVLDWGLGLLRSMVTLILISLVLGWLFPKFMKVVPENLWNQPWPSLGWGIVSIAAASFAGLVIFVGMLVFAIVFGLLSLSGLSATIVFLGILALLALTIGFCVVLFYLVKILVGENIGKWILARVNPKLAENKYLPSILGIVLIVLCLGLLSFPLLPFIGVFGFLLNLAIILFGFGALWIWGRDAWQARTA